MHALASVLATAVCAVRLGPAWHAHGQHHGHVRSAALAMGGAVGLQPLSVVHKVPSLSSAVQFYQSSFGLDVSASGTADGGRPYSLLCHPGVEGSLCLKLVEMPGAGYDAASGYGGLSVRVTDLEAVAATVAANGGRIVKEPSSVDYGASLFPDEDEETVTSVQQALVTDPDGYPVLLYQGSGEDPALLCAVRLNVHEWKRSEEWYQQVLGWSKLRWQAALPREASITVTVGPEGLPVGPCGPIDGAARPAVLLRYAYGSAPIQGADALEALVVRAASAETDRVQDPDGYQIVFEK